MICTPNTGYPVLGVHITLERLYLFVHFFIYSLNQKSQQVGRTVCLGREGVREAPISDIL